VKPTLSDSNNLATRLSVKEEEFPYHDVSEDEVLCLDDVKAEVKQEEEHKPLLSNINVSICALNALRSSYYH